jgi:putative hemolysin
MELLLEPKEIFTKCGSTKLGFRCRYKTISFMTTVHKKLIVQNWKLHCANIGMNGGMCMAWYVASKIHYSYQTMGTDFSNMLV